MHPAAFTPCPIIRKFNIRQGGAALVVTHPTPVVLSRVIQESDMVQDGIAVLVVPHASCVSRRQVTLKSNLLQGGAATLIVDHPAIVDGFVSFESNSRQRGITAIVVHPTSGPGCIG